MHHSALRFDRHTLEAVAIWALFALAIGVYVAAGGRRTVTPTYQIAAGAWFEGGRLYNAGGIGGFLYFPQAALIYAPFTLLPFTVGEVLWRSCGLALFATGIWRLVGLIDLNRRGRQFLWFTVLCVPATVSAARNGQMNLHLAGLLLHATVDLAAGVWWRAALALTVGIALKPLGLVATLLAAAAYPRTRWWLLGMIVGAAAVPFLLQRPAYVVEQYAACSRRLLVASAPDSDTWSDLRGLLLRLHVYLSNGMLMILRLVAAAATLIGAFMARRQGKAWSAVLIFALGSAYLMIFNPRTESNSYVILAPAVASIAWLAARKGQSVALGLLVVLAVVLGCENYGRTIFLATDLWLKPLLTIVFSAYLLAVIVGRKITAEDEQIVR